MANDIYTRILSNEEGFDSLAAAWDELLDESNQCVYFLRWSWNRIWWKTYAPPNSELYLITCYDSADQLVGIAPLYLRKSSIPSLPGLNEVVFLGTGIPITTSENLDLISRRGYEMQVAKAVAKVLLEDLRVHRLCLAEIPITSITLPHLRRSLSGPQLLSHVNRYHYVDTSVSWDEFMLTLGKSTRSKIKRSMRKLEHLGSWGFYSSNTTEELEPAISGLIRLHQARWRSKGEPGSFSLKPFRDFMRDTMHAALAEGRLKLWTMTIQGKAAAALLAFQDNGVAHYFQGGFDPRYQRESLGMVMFSLCIRACIEDETIQRFNFMGGDVAYKAHWTHHGIDSVTLKWLRPGLRSTLFKFYEFSESSGKSLLRAVVPKSVRTAWRRRMTS